MDNTDLLKQTSEPAFPKLLWSQPQNKASAGKLLIVGGSSHSFNSLSRAYAASLKAGIGTVRVIAPDVLARPLAKIFPEIQFAPSTVGGNFARSALAEILDNTAWADGLLLAGDFGNNSETVIMLESLLTKYKGSAVIAGDTLDSLDAKVLLGRVGTVVVADINRLQKLAATDGVALKKLADLLQMTNQLAQWSRAADLATVFEDFTVVSADKKVSITAGSADLVELATYSSVWQIQHPAKIFQALTSAAYAYINNTY